MKEKLLAEINRLRENCGDLCTAAQCGWQMALDKVELFIKEGQR